MAPNVCPYVCSYFSSVFDKSWYEDRCLLAVDCSIIWASSVLCDILYQSCIIDHFEIVALPSISKGWPGWVDLCSWSHTEIKVPHRELNPDTVTHLGSNRSQRRLTSLMCATPLPLSRQHRGWLALKLNQNMGNSWGRYLPHLLLHPTTHLCDREWCIS